MTELVAPPNAESVLAQEFKVQESCALVVDVPGAHTRLRPTTQGARVAVDVTITGVAADAAEAVMNHLRLSTRQVKDTVRITSAPPPTAPDWWRWLRDSPATVYLDVTVPPQVDADVHVPGGAVDAADLTGRFTLAASGGRVQADGLSGTLTLRSRGSAASVRDFSGDRLTVRAAAGRVSVRNVSVEETLLRGSGAALTVETLEGPLSVRGFGAPVTIDGLSGPCRGRVEGSALTFVGPIDADTHLTTVGGTLTTRLPADQGAALTMAGPSLALDDAFAFEGERDPARIVGTLNKGGPSLQLRAVNGSVRCEAQSSS